MSFKSPMSPNQTKSYKFRVFDGIGGPQTQILKRFDPRRGYDISNTVFNDLIDLNLGKYGEMALRDGKRKILDEGQSDTVESLFMVNIAGRKRYAIKHGESLDVIDIPIRNSFNQAPLNFSPGEYRAWTVTEVNNTFTVTTLLEKTVQELLRDLINTIDPVESIYTSAYPGDPL